jgi:hypothetical protein
MITITTYKELKEYIKAFGQRKINFLIINSRGGLGKSKISEDILAENSPLILNSHCAPLAMYKILMSENLLDKEFIAIFDDVDEILKNKSAVAILKAVCDSKKEKIVRYTTTSPLLEKGEESFTTSCKVLLLTNQISEGDANLRALMTRAVCVNFNPSDKEILSFLKTFADDLEILKYIEKFVKFSTKFNFRIYCKALELKLSKLDWKREVLNSMEIDMRYSEIENLLTKYKTDLQREKKFNGSRATYYRWKKLYQQKLNK